MARRRLEQRRQQRSPSPDDATVVELVVQNLRLLAELRARYRSAPRGGPVGQDLRSPQQAYDLLAPEMEALPQEQLRVVLLNTRNRVLDVVVVYQGSVHTAVVRLAELFRDAIIANAPAIVIAHNHPSGDPEPSPSDLEMTRQAGQVAQLLGIELLDHVVIGQGRFVSLKERGII
jgi:DNA repair protein RadC